MADRFTAEEIDAAARGAGLELTPQWREDLVEGSQGIVVARRAIRTPRDMSAEPAHVFVPARR